MSLVFLPGQALDKNTESIIIKYINLKFICISTQAFRQIFRERKQNMGGTELKRIP